MNYIFLNYFFNTIFLFRDPFERTMAFWLIKEYAQAASTLIREASKDTLFLRNSPMEHSLSDIFNFYSYLRRHPLVVLH